MADTVGEFGVRAASGQSTTLHASPSPDFSDNSSGEGCSFFGDTTFEHILELQDWARATLGAHNPNSRIPFLEDLQPVPSPASDECMNASFDLPELGGSDDNHSVTIHINRTILSRKVDLHGRRSIEKDTLYWNLVDMLSFRPDWFMIQTASDVGELKREKWELPGAHVAVPAGCKLFVSVQFPPPSHLIPPDDREMSSRVVPLAVQEATLPEPPGQIAVVAANQQPEQRSSLSLSPLQRSGSSSPEPRQSREVLEALYEWMQSHKLFKPGLVDLGLPPWELIDWPDDPTHAEVDPTRQWLLMGKLIYKEENGIWKRNLHTAQPPSCLIQSRWWNRNQKLQRQIKVGDNLTAHVVRRYFVWVPGTKYDAEKEAGKRWKDYSWVLHEDVPADVIRQTFPRRDYPAGGPEYYGLFKLTLRKRLPRRTDTDNPSAQHPVEARGTKRGFEGPGGGAYGQPGIAPDRYLDMVSGCHGFSDSKMYDGPYAEEEEGWEWVDVYDEEDYSDLSEGQEEWGGGVEASQECDVGSAADGRESGAGSMAGEGEKCQAEAQEALVAGMSSLGISSSSSLASSGSSGPREFLATELASVTGDFSEKLDEANEEFYEGFKGAVDDGSKVAVKRGRLKISSEAFEEIKQKQVQISHRNLTPVMGFCPDADCQALVFALPKGQSLHTRLYGKRGPDNPMLSWSQRLLCALDILSALEYLHKKQAVPHGRLSSRNVFVEPSGSIVLANWMVPGLADVLGKVYEGSDEYLSANEYYNTEYYGGQPDRLSDVAALGMLFLEIISGRAPYNSALPAEQTRLLPWAQTCYKEKTIAKFVDVELLPLLDSKELMQALRLMKLALRCCTQRDRTTRPTVLEATSKVLGIMENVKWSPVGNLGEGSEGSGEVKAEMSPPREIRDKVPAGLYGLQQAVFDASTSKSKEATQ